MRIENLQIRANDIIGSNAQLKLQEKTPQHRIPSHKMSNPKNFLITGAARGIGRGLSRLLLAKGHRVLLIDNNSEELTHLASKLSQTHTLGKDYEYLELDLERPEEIEQIFVRRSNDDIIQRFFSSSSHLDVLINNAADTSAVGKSPLSNLKLKDWNKSLAVNLTAPMLLSQACLPFFSQKKSSPEQQQRGSSGGSIINISSSRALQSEPNNEPYSATKAGLLGLTQSMAVSLAPQNVRVNAILPGWIHVENESKEADEKGTTWEDGLTEEDHRWHLTGRVGKVEDILRAVEYLVENEGVTGSEMIVDGGVTRKMVYPE